MHTSLRYNESEVTAESLGTSVEFGSLLEKEFKNTFGHTNVAITPSVYFGKTLEESYGLYQAILTGNFEGEVPITISVYGETEEPKFSVPGFFSFRK